MAEPLPEALSELVSRLRALGFEPGIEQTGSSSFPYRMVELTEPTRATGRSVKLLCDRGLWEVSVEVAGEWVDPYLVLRALDGKDFSRRALNHVERRDMTLEAIGRLPDSAAELGPVVERLQAFERQY